MIDPDLVAAYQKRLEGRAANPGLFWGRDADKGDIAWLTGPRWKVSHAKAEQVLAELTATITTQANSASMDQNVATPMQNAVTMFGENGVLKVPERPPKVPAKKGRVIVVRRDCGCGQVEDIVDGEPTVVRGGIKHRHGWRPPLRRFVQEGT